MKLTYSPEGVEPMIWDFLPSKMLNVEAELIEDVTGWTYQEFQSAFIMGSSKARHALLWVFLKRTKPNLRYDAVQFAQDELVVDWSEHERSKLIEELGRKSAAEGLDSDEQELYDVLLEEQQARKPKPEVIEEDPKAKRKSGAPRVASATSSH